MNLIARKIDELKLLLLPKQIWQIKPKCCRNYDKTEYLKTDYLNKKAVFSKGVRKNCTPCFEKP